jgi:hypothetical protein
MRATKIRMKAGCESSEEPLEIDQVFIVGKGIFTTGWYEKDFLHDHLMANPGTIQVNLPPYHNLTPVFGARHAKCVKSSPDKANKDALLSLPKE